ncbi:Scr1 family TA system antitoxin-like transcriptional regulator [Actinokineospora guangxiensis]
MSGERRHPHARDRMIGAQLRFIRLNRTTLLLDAAAKAAQLSEATLSRVENGKRHITVEDAATLLTIYGVPAADRTELVNAVRDCGRTAGQWLRPLPGVLPDTSAASQEVGVRDLTSWAPTTVPALLHTPAYAIASMAAAGIPAAEAERRWSARARRQEQAHTADHTLYIHEFALRTPFGGPAALKEQILRLTDSGVRVRLVRAGTVLSTLSHGWTLMRFPQDPAIVHIELQDSSVYLHAPETSPYERQATHLHQAACSTAETQHRLSRFVASL